MNANTSGKPVKTRTAPAKRVMGGRPSKNTAATRRQILKYAARGLPLVHCAAVAGISLQSLSNYRRERPQFADALARAIAKGVDRNLRVIEQALDSEDMNVRLRASTWFLEHTQPQHFARNRIEVTGADGAPLMGAVAVYLPQKDGMASGSRLITVDTPKGITNGNDG